MAKMKDEFSQIGYIQVVESAANTLTFNGISVFSNILTPKGLLLHSMEYDVPAAVRTLLVAENDGVVFGMAGSDDLSAINLDNPQVYDYNGIFLAVRGAAASGFMWDNPVRVDYTMLPGGGKLVPADRLYAYVAGVSVASAATIAVRFNFTLIDLTAQQYIELAQSLRVLT